MANNPVTQLYSQLPLAASFNSFGDYYPVPVSLGETGTQYSDYYWMCIDAMLTDDEIVADLALRHATAAQTPYKVEGSEEDIAWAQSVLSELNLDTLLKHCLYLADYGFNPVELTWRKDADAIRPIMSERRHPRAFRWAKDGRLLYSASGQIMDYQPIPNGKIIPTVRNGSREKPYGESVLESAWATWQTKWTHVEQLERLAAKYSVPSTIALVDGAGTSEESLMNIAGQMAYVEGGGSTALAGVREVVQLTASGKASELMAVIEKYDSKLSKLITGQTLTSGNQQYGSRALGEVHERAALRISADDACAVFDALNRTLLSWIFAFNRRAGKIRIVFDKKAFEASMTTMQGNAQGSGTGLPPGITLADNPPRFPLTPRARGLCL